MKVLLLNDDVKEVVGLIIDEAFSVPEDFQIVADEVENGINDLVTEYDVFSLDMDSIMSLYEPYNEDGEATTFLHFIDDVRNEQIDIDRLLECVVIVCKDWTDYINEIADNYVDIYYTDLWAWHEKDKGDAIEDYLQEFGYNGEDFYALIREAQYTVINNGLYTVLYALIERGIVENT